MSDPLPIATFLTSDGDETEITVDSQTTLREAAREAGVNVHDRCGGMGACCSCVITVISGAENIYEKTIIEAAVFYLAAGDRLSCQCKITGDVVVKVSS